VDARQYREGAIVNPTGQCADTTRVRARGLGSLMAVLMSGGIGVMTMRSCQSSPSSSPSNPLNMARTGSAGICANEQAVNDAGSADDPVPAVTLPPDLAAKLGKADPAAAAIVAQATSCTSVTDPP